MKSTSTSTDNPADTNIDPTNSEHYGVAVPGTGFAANGEILLAIGTVGIALFVKPSSGNVTARIQGYHSLAYVILTLALHSVLSMLSGIFGPFMQLYYPAFFAGFAYLLWRAWHGRPTTFPILAEIARKQAGVSA
jgi:hypothetical protein